ncbi:MAG: helix-turn-helix domain-containing protein [Faecousia sp.]
MYRIKELRESKGLNMKETARLLGMPYTTYVNYEKEQREPTSEILIQLADFFETSVDYLVGRTNCSTNSSATPTILPPTPLKLDPNEEQMIRKFRTLDDRGKSAVLNVLNFEYDSLSGDKAISPAKEA